MKITTDFEGGNVVVEDTDGNVVRLRADQRDSGEKWFYWCFAVEGAEGQTVKFVFDDEIVGYFGAAVSHDNLHYAWQHSDFGRQGNSFVYTFKKDEKKVYFAHDLAYRTKRFENFCAQNGLKMQTFCKSQKGRDLPYITFGTGKKTVILTSRHHACESTGTYVLEGVLDELIARPLKGFKIVCVPFVDLDGVVDGDQGKARLPHDHNRDYVDAPIYETTKKLQEIIRKEKVVCGFDFHSPWHWGGENDKVFIVRNEPSGKEIEKFSSIFEKEITKNAMRYRSENDYPVHTGWNQGKSPTFYKGVFSGKNAKLAFSLETAYFGEKDNPFSIDGAIELGRCFARAVKKYLNA